MSHVAAPLRLVELAWLPIWALALLPLLLGGAAAVLLGARNYPRLQGLQSRARAAGRALGHSPTGLGVGAGLALALAGVVVLVAQAATKKALVVSPGLRLFRVGSLDATLGGSVDLGRGLGAALALAVALRALRRLDAPEADGPSTPLALGALASGALAVALGDGAALVVLGLELLVVGVVLLGFASGADDPRPALAVLGAGQLAVAAFAVAFGYAAWGFGGTWLEGPGEAPGSAVYLPAASARFAAVERGERPRPEAETKSTKGRREAAVRARELAKARAYLTMTTHPGARVYLGVGDQQQLRSAQPIGVSPFVRLPIPAGVQTLAIAPDGGATITGDGWEIAAIENVSLEADEERTLLALGPSLSLSELEAEAAVVGADGGGVVTASAQNARPIGRLGASVAGLSMLGVLGWVGAVAWAAAPRRRASAGVRGSGLALAGALAAAGFSFVLFPRLGFLWDAAAGGRALALLAWALTLVGGALAVLSRAPEPAPAKAAAPVGEAGEADEGEGEEDAPEAPAAPAPAPKRAEPKRRPKRTTAGGSEGLRRPGSGKKGARS